MQLPNGQSKTLLSRMSAPSQGTRQEMLCGYILKFSFSEMLHIHFSANSKLNFKCSFVYILLILSHLFITGYCFPDQGKWDFVINNDKGEGFIGVSKSLYKNSEVIIKVTCQSAEDVQIAVGWVLRETPCWEEYLFLEQTSNADQDNNLVTYYNMPWLKPKVYNYKSVNYIKTEEYLFTCNERIVLEGISQKQLESKEVPQETTTTSNAPPTSDSEVPLELPTPLSRRMREAEDPNGGNATSNSPGSNHPQFVVPADGVYLLSVHVRHSDLRSAHFKAKVHVEMKGTYGYLSAADWPLLPFYGVMCLVYVLYGLAWLIISFCQWRDLLRIQFWIGGVIVLGMLEKAVFYAEYETINATGSSVRGAVIFAELVSCGKRTLARMLVVIVSLGFGIVKPRLGPMLHRVIGVGLTYFILGSVEGCLRVLKPKNDPSNQALLASIPLAVLDSAICWWIFSSLVQTTRTLRLRRNDVKLSLYRHFTNTLIFAVVASIAFMIWSIKYHRLAECLTDWKELWADEAYWHILFSIILLVIMVLWRPTNNNSRYAFSPLLDAADDEEEEFIKNDAFEGMKMRGEIPSGIMPRDATGAVLSWDCRVNQKLRQA